MTRSTDVARRMVTESGMSLVLGPVRLAARLCEQETVAAEEITVILAQTSPGSGHLPAPVGLDAAAPAAETRLAVN